MEKTLPGILYFSFLVETGGKPIESLYGKFGKSL